MNDEQFIWEAYLDILKESVTIRDIRDFSDSEKNEILSKLSDVERYQLSKPKGGTSSRSYMSAEDWVVIRDYTLRSALDRNPDTNPDLCAYTPGETLKLLNHPTVKSWFEMVKTFKVPENKEKVIFVSCAAHKRWGATTKALDYKCINMLRSKESKTYWVTISEPLGIIPEDHWDDFPLYDNPGLFKEGGFNLSTKKWKSLMGRQTSYYYPFDDDAKKECIKILADVIKSFYQFNKNINPNLKFISAVETHTEKSTHSDMLDVSGILQKEHRFFKLKRGEGSTKEARISHWKEIEKK